MCPFFSIITPVHNSSKFLKKCIQSVIDQTYTSWELILIDDGSTDSSGKICDSFCFDSRIRIIHQNNKGALLSRIKGIAIAEGIYGIGLDSDDYLDPNCLETVKKAIDVSDSDMILFGYRFLGKQRGNVICTLAPGLEYPQKVIIENIIKELNHALWNKAIKIEKIRDVKYSIANKKLSVNLDYAQIIPILCKINTAYVIDDILYNYRIYENSISHSYKVQHIFDTGLITNYVIHILKTYSLLDLEIYNTISLAYLKMVVPRVVELFSHDKISKEQCKNIHKTKAYINSKEMEKLEYLNQYDFLVLKLFRYKQYWLLKKIVKLQKIQLFL